MESVGVIVHDSEALRELIERSGVSKIHIANNMKIQTRTLNEKIDGKRDFWWHEVLMLKRILRMTDEEFEKIFGW